MLVEQMSKEIGLPQDQILKIAKQASHAYKTYSIKKRSSAGYRTISHPSRILKLLQSWLATRFLSVLPIHECVYSYRKDISIKAHAAIHQSNNYLLRVDLTDFFPSITQKDIYNLLLANRELYSPNLTDEDFKFVLRVACKGNAITIGAPSSPVLSNAILYNFDVIWAKRAKELSVIYTRYADDLYFSTNEPNVLSKVLEEVRENLNTLSWPKLRINELKTIFTSRKRKRVVTGLVLTSTNKLSIGRDKKRHVKSLIHQFILGKLSESDASYLKGYLSYAVNVEPSFMESLKTKYGEGFLVELSKLKYVTRKRKYTTSKTKK